MAIHSADAVKWMKGKRKSLLEMKIIRKIGECSFSLSIGSTMARGEFIVRNRHPDSRVDSFFYGLSITKKKEGQGEK